MRLLLVHRHFWPDATTYSTLLKLLAEHLVENGHEVTVVTAQPSYNDLDLPKRARREVIAGVEIRRVRLLRERKSQRLRRIINSILFAAQVAIHGCTRARPYHLTTVSTFPPVIMGLAARTIAAVRRTPFLYHCMDLYPEIAVRSGVIRPSPITDLMRRVDARTCSQAHRVVVLSSDMKALLAERGVDTGRTEIINNFTLQDPRPIDPEPRSAPVRFAFTGNMGRFQGLERLLEAFAELEDDFDMLFLGAGELRDSLEEAARTHDSISFRNQVPIDQVLDVMADRDVGIVSLRPGVIAAAYPSKLMTYLAAGCRVLAIVERDSALARFILDSDIGSVAEAGDPSSIVAALQAEMARGTVSSTERARIQGISEEQFGRASTLARWSELIHRIDSERNP